MKVVHRPVLRNWLSDCKTDFWNLISVGIHFSLATRIDLIFFQWKCLGTFILVIEILNQKIKGSVMTTLCHVLQENVDYLNQIPKKDALRKC